MRLSSLAARSAASVHSRCVNNPAFHPSPRPCRLSPTILCVGISLSIRRYVVSPCLENVSREEAEGRRKETRRVDIAALRILEEEIEQNPTKVLTEHESSMRHAHQRQRYINLMRTVPNPIAIVTTTRQDVEEKDAILMGATVSSFKSVCMDPDPHISFNLHQQSRTFQMIKDHKYFCITIPRNDTAGHRLARSFTFKSLEEAYMDSPDGFKVVKHHWKLALEGGMPSDMRNPPPAVKSYGAKGAKTDGLAFAFLCQYHGSIVVGDHVVVTARVLPASIASASPWGRDDVLGDSFASADLTLSYVHGSFGNPELLSGTDQFWKLDDPYITQIARKAIVSEQLKAIDFFEKRLQVVELVSRDHRSEGHDPDLVQTPEYKRARQLSQIQLTQYREYYKNRLLEYRKVLKLPIIRNEPENPLEEMKTQMKADGDFVEENPGMHEWSEQALLNKALLSDQKLEEEAQLYLARLDMFRRSREETMSEIPEFSLNTSDQPNQQTLAPGDTAATDNKKSEVESDSSSSSSAHNSDLSTDETAETAERRQKMITYFQRRLSLVRQAQKMRAEAVRHPKVPKTRFVEDSIEKKQRLAKSFLGSRRAFSFNELISEYREYQVQITETRLARIQCIFQKDQYNEPLLEKLEERLSYFEERLDLTARVISERYKGDDPETWSKTPVIIEKNTMHFTTATARDRIAKVRHDRQLERRESWESSQKSRVDKPYIRHIRPRNEADDGEDSRAGEENNMGR